MPVLMAMKEKILLKDIENPPLENYIYREEDLQNRQRPSAAVFFFADALFPKFLKTGIAGEESEGVLDECVNQEKAVD